MNLLSTDDQLAVKAALQDVIDTFFKYPVVINLNSTVADKYGEGPVKTVTPFTFDVLIDFSVGKSGRYQDIDKTDMGQRAEDSFHIYFWADDIRNSGITIDPTSASVHVSGIPSVPDGEYEIRLFTPTAYFSDLGFLLYDMEIKIYGG